MAGEPRSGEDTVISGKSQEGVGKLKVVKPGLSLEIGVEVVRGPGMGGGPSRWREQPVQKPGEGIIADSETKQHWDLEER